MQLHHLLTVLFLPFWSSHLSFLSYFIVLAGASNTLLSRIGYLSHLPKLKGRVFRISRFIIKWTVVLGLGKFLSILSRVCMCVFVYVCVLIINGIQFLLLALHVKIILLFVFLCLKPVNGFQVFKSALHSWDKLYLVMIHYFLCYFSQFAKILWRILASLFIGDCNLQFPSNVFLIVLWGSRVRRELRKVWPLRSCKRQGAHPPWSLQEEGSCACNVT